MLMRYTTVQAPLYTRAAYRVSGFCAVTVIKANLLQNSQKNIGWGGCSATAVLDIASSFLNDAP